MNTCTGDNGVSDVTALMAGSGVRSTGFASDDLVHALNEKLTAILLLLDQVRRGVSNDVDVRRIAEAQNATKEAGVIAEQLRIGVRNGAI